MSDLSEIEYYKRRVKHLEKELTANYHGGAVHIALTVLNMPDPERGTFNTGDRDKLRKAKSKSLDVLISELGNYTPPQENNQ